jgi:hypothetical protein
MATTKFDEVLLMNRQTGIVIIQTGTPLTRLNYFDGKFLRAQDLQAEQRYTRSMVELSNQAGGFGVVHGFDISLGGSDMLTLMPGLAVDPEGRVLMLPQECTLSIQDLIDRSRESAGISKRAAIPGAAEFAQCVEVSEKPGVSPVASRNWYLITIASAEALCGEEDVYGKLCEEACITSTDRPWRVEGIVLRAYPLPLTAKLATASAVSLNRSHLRSLIASAWFEAEKERASSLISKPGLESSVWCQGARDYRGSEVALAVLVREGTSTMFMDRWIVRREIMDTPPKRYWQVHMGMRPWDVYLAQILQFQCQLRDAFRTSPPAASDDDPCSQAQQLVSEAVQHFDALSGFYQETTANLARMSANSRNLVLKEMPAAKVGMETIATFRDRLVKASRIFQLLPQDRLLIGRGIIELPSAGYLPVIPESTISVNRQVRRLMGEGVDLRFCIVRPDYVPHALEEAQHMERISLLEGLDHPNAKPQVDVLVPNGKIAPEVTEQERFYDMRLNIIPANLQLLAQAARPALNLTEDRRAYASLESGAAFRSLALDVSGAIAKVAPDTIELRGAGRSEEPAGGGVAFYYAGASQSFRIENPAKPPASAGEGLRLNQPDVATLDTATVSDRLAPEFIRARLMNIVGEFAQPQTEPDVNASVWLSMQLDRDVAAMKQGESANARAECRFLLSASAKSKRGDVVRNEATQVRTVLVTAAFTGHLEVETQESRSGEPQFGLARAILAGTLAITVKRAAGQQSYSLYLSERIEITSSVGSGGPSLTIKMTEPSVLKALVQEFEVTRQWKTPTQADGAGFIDFRTFREQAENIAAQPMTGAPFLADRAIRATIDELNISRDIRSVLAGLAASSRVARREAFRTWQTVDGSVYESNHPAHQLAISGLRKIGAEIGMKFADINAALLFPTLPPKNSEMTVVATEPWVLFHRRRDRICSEDRPVTRAETRQYALYQIPLPGRYTVAALKKVLEQGSAVDLKALELKFVELVEFGAGVHSVITPRAQVGATWKQKIGTDEVEIAGGVIASRGLAVAEGESLAENRLESLVEILSAETPPIATPQYAVLGSVPGSLDTGQNDGIIIVATKPIPTECQDVYVVDSATKIRRLKEVAGRPELANILKELEADLLGPACFRENTAEDVKETIAAVVDNWNKKYPGRSVGESLLIYKKGDPAVDHHGQQADVIVKALKGTVPSDKKEGPAILPDDRPAITVVAPVAVQPAMKKMRMIIPAQIPLAIAVFNTAGALKQSDIFSLKVDGGLAGALPAAVTDWINANLATNKLSAIALVVRTDPPDSGAENRLKTMLELLSNANVGIGGVNPRVVSLPSLGAEANKLEPYINGVDDLLVLTVSGTKRRRKNR